MLWIAIISLVLAVFFGTVTVLNWVGIAPPLMRKPWTGMKKLVDKLASRIQQEEFQPDVVIGIEGGGIIIGGLLVTNWASRLGGDVPFYIQPQRYVKTEKGKLEKVIRENVIPDERIKGKNVLVVDSLVYTGDTMKEVTRVLEKKAPKAIKTAVLFRLKGTAFRPDIYIKEVRKRQLMPWAFTEEYKDKYGKWDD